MDLQIYLELFKDIGRVFSFKRHLKPFFLVETLVPDGYNGRFFFYHAQMDFTVHRVKTFFINQQ